jgi:hypothetical protein
VSHRGHLAAFGRHCDCGTLRIRPLSKEVGLFFASHVTRTFGIVRFQRFAKRSRSKSRNFLSTLDFRPDLGYDRDMKNASLKKLEIENGSPSMSPVIFR